MARKSVKGYAEKNYYDNTKFTGGVVATNDPLNEGSFKHLVNFDIADTGQSLTPRKGFLTTALKYKQDGVDVEVALSDKTIYYFDANIGKWIFIDFTVFDSKNLVPNMFKVEFDVNNKYISNVEKITNFSTHNLNIPPWNNSKAPLVSNILPKTYTISTNYAQSAIDEYNTTQYIIKVKYGNDSICWFTFSYRENESEYEGITYPADTLVLSCLDTKDVVDKVDTSQRNLASFESIIPDPMQTIYKDGEEPLGFIQQFPMIYIKDTNNKYLINNTQNIDGLTIIPNYYLKEIPDNVYTYTDEVGATIETKKYYWAYTYDIFSTSVDNEFLGKNIKHESNIYSLSDNSTLVGYDFNKFFDDKYYDELSEILDSSSWDLFGTVYTLDYSEFMRTSNAFIYSLLSYRDHLKHIDSLNVFDGILNGYNIDHTVIIYIVPKIDETLFNTIQMPSEMFDFTDSIDYLQTVWYSNNYYTFPDERLVITNYPEITTRALNVDTSEYTEFEGATATDVYKECVDYYSIYKHYKEADYSTIIESLISQPYISTTVMLERLSALADTCYFYIQPLSNSKKDYRDIDAVGYNNIAQTAIHAQILSFPNIGITFEELKTFIKDHPEYIEICFKFFNRASIIRVEGKMDYVLNNNYHRPAEINKLLPGVLTQTQNYYIYYNVNNAYTEFKEIPVSDHFVYDIPRSDALCNLFTVHSSSDNSSHIVLHPDDLTYLPCLDYFVNDLNNLYLNAIGVVLSDRRVLAEDSLFQINNNILQAKLQGDLYNKFKEDNYFEQGIYIVFYLLQIPDKKYLTDKLPEFNSYTRNYFINTTTLVQSRIVSKSTIKPTTYVEYLTEEPTLIKNAKEDFIFRSTLGDHLVLWAENKLYISKESKQYYFPATGYSFSYPETIVKAIQYKDMILVFTTQNLYAVYLTEYVTTVQNGTDDQGNPKYVQQSTYEFATLPVLYNLMVDERYKDAIQVYNQMILFYSADGQMFLIKPTAAIDSNTRFSIQYFNKSVNDILLNYKDYMQERLNVYKVDKVITDVKIKVSTSINFIKIFYTAPDIMTYILIYDIINNRYYVYDTLLFSNIVGLHFIPEGELYVVEDKNRIYFTLPYAQPNEPDNNVDIASYDNFSRNAIKSEIDTGVINLNNHLKKRFKDLHVIYKNLNATDLEFSLDTFIDDVPIITYLDSSLEIRNVSSHNTIVSEDYYNTLNLLSKNINSFSSADYNSTKFVVHNTVDFLEDNTVLFNFTDYTSNKVITHRSNIVSKGKAIRTKMYFTSKGKYKIQGYGLVYKEHTV